jgi:protocatechuate 3,4-dioxygenase beta subunit
MATHNHQKLNGAAKRSGRTTKSRSLAAIMAGATLGGVLAAGGALGFIETAKAATVALTGTAFIDINSDGKFSTSTDATNKSQNDVLVGGVTVTAYTATGAVAGSTKSLANGSWSMQADGIAPFRLEFTTLPNFTYEGFNRQNTVTQFTDGAPRTLGLYAKLSSLGEIQDITGIEGVQIGDRVWADADGNGRQDPGEVGIDGVVVELLSATGVPILDKGQPIVSTTEAGGLYVFNGVSPQTQYRVRIAGGQAALANYDLTIENITTAGPLNDSNGKVDGSGASANVLSPPLGANSTYDFGYKPKVVLGTLKLGNFVFSDTNGNNVQDAADTGLKDAKVELLNATDQVLQTINATPADGSYLFQGVSAGLYRVRFTRPAGSTAVAVTPGIGTDRALDSNPDATGDPAVSVTKLFQLSADDLTIDAGWTATTSATHCLGDLVWTDTDKDGKFTAGEKGLAGVKVILLDADGKDTATTKDTYANGRYQFCGLPNGTNNRVRFVLPAGYTFTKQTDVARDNESSANQATGVSLPGTIQDKDCSCLDAGLVADPGKLLVLGDTVWLDANDDGIKQDNEAAVANAIVTLLDEAGTPVSGVAPFPTGENGQYKFTGLKPGKYKVRFARPAGTAYTPAKSKVGGNDITDSDGIADTGNATSTTGVIDLQSDNLNVDAGWVAPVPPATGLKLGDLVFIDTDRDGLAFAKDTPVDGALVELLNESGTGAALKSTRSDKDGKYLFTDLTAGKYRVRFTRPDGTTVTPTTTNATADSINDSNGVKVSDSVSLTDVIDLKADDLTIDAGWVTTPVTAPTYCLGDIVFDDVNGNGIKEDNEPGVNGVVVTVTNSSGGTGQTTTANGGLWKVCGLSNGNFTVAFSKPAGYDFTIQGAANNRSNVDANGKTGTVTIANGDNLTVDAGIKLTPTALVIVVAPAPIAVATTVAPTTTAPAANLCIGDKVFVDATGSAKDGKGISGVTITLVRPDGTTATATTDANGAYKFCSLTAGAYSVKVNPATLPAGAVATYDLAGKKTNEATVTLTNADNADLDFGYKLPSASVLGNTVETAPPAAAQVPDEPIAFTGSNTTTTMLWGLALLMMGMGFAGLMVDRRRTVTR